MSTYLIDVGVPHLGQESHGGRGVRVVVGELHVSLQRENKLRSSSRSDFKFILIIWINFAVQPI